MTSTETKTDGKEKKLVALSSVLAAVFITAFKLTIGLLTHSLGILAEAAHSALDLVAALVTLFAVRVSDRPADEKHAYGYGKIENLSALFEALLLLITCGWIIYEAVDRLFYNPVQVEVSIWSFIVMITSIAIDVTRSRALMKAAKKHDSQALEADALHFSTDVWSSAVVIGGLVLITLGELLQKSNLASPEVVAWLNRADAIAALGVSLIVIYVSVELGKRTIEGLLDTTPQGMEKAIRDAVSGISGITRIRRVRIRPSGPYMFVDMLIEVARTTTLETAHNLTVQAKKTILDIYPRADVVVHIDPMVQNEKSLVEMVHSVAGRNNLNVHSIYFHSHESRINLEMHMEVPEELTLAEAHEKATVLESALRVEIPRLEDVVTHIEPAGDEDTRRSDTLSDSDKLRSAISQLREKFPDVSECHQISIWQDGENLSVSFHCSMQPNVSIKLAHQLSSQMEQELRTKIGELKHVVIHVEPPEK